MHSEAVRDAALVKGALHPAAIAADVGAGTGFITRGLAPQVARVYAIDSSPEMMHVARRNLAAFATVEYRLADGTALPLPDGSVETVLANMYLHHVSDPLAAIHEMARLLKSRGRVVITDLDKRAYTWLQEEHHDVWLGFDRGEVETWFEPAGLLNVQVEARVNLAPANHRRRKARLLSRFSLLWEPKPDPRAVKGRNSSLPFL